MKCRVCHDTQNRDGILCPVCSDFGLTDSIAEAAISPELDHSDAPTVRQMIEHLREENAALSRKIHDIQQNADRWQALVLAICNPKEMDEINQLFVQFLSSPWRN